MGHIKYGRKTFYNMYYLRSWTIAYLLFNFRQFSYFAIFATQVVSYVAEINLIIGFRFRASTQGSSPIRCSRKVDRFVA